MRRIAFHSQVKRGLARIGDRNGARGGLAVGGDPARYQPRRRVERGGIELRQQRRALAGEPAQHGVDQAGEVLGVAVGLHQADGEIDRRMIGHVEKKDLRCADQQRRFDARCILGRAALEQLTNEVAQGAKPPEHDRDQRPR